MTAISSHFLWYFELDHITWQENVHCIKKKRLMPRKFICFKPFTLRRDYGETICLINLWKNRLVLPFKWNLSVRIVTKSTGGYSAKFCMVRFSPPPPSKKKIPLQTLLTEEDPHLYTFLIPQTSFCRETTGGVTCEMSAVFSCYSFRRLTGVCLVLFFQVFGKLHLPWASGLAQKLLWEFNVHM